MRVFVKRFVYESTKDYARAQNMTVSDLVELSLIKHLGLEGRNEESPAKVPMDVHEIFGEEGGCHGKGEVEIVNPGASQAVEK